MNSSGYVGIQRDQPFGIPHDILLSIGFCRDPISLVITIAMVKIITEIYEDRQTYEHGGV